MQSCWKAAILLLLLVSDGYSAPMQTSQEISATQGMTVAQELQSEQELQAEQETQISQELQTGQETQATSMERLLRTAIEPLGNTMYIWGGGWNEEDTGAGVEALSLGVSPRWKEFAGQQDSSYNYKNTRYQIHDGLDCSGYVGWVIYNVFETAGPDGEEGNGYVFKAEGMAEKFAEFGWGTYREPAEVTEWMPGDIMSMSRHVWISLGMCSDGSVLLIHSAPPGVRICGTFGKDGSRSEAVELAEQCMSQYYPLWYERYPECGVSYSYLTASGQMRWNEILTDDSGIKEMDAYETAEFLFR